MKVALSIGQDAVFDRAEQRLNDAKQKQREKQQRNRVQPKPADGQGCNADLEEFQPLRHPRLVVTVGHLSADGG